MRITIAHKVGKVDGVWIAVHIYEHLVQKRGIIILRTEFQLSFANGDAEGSAEAVVPSFLLVEVIVDDNLSIAGQQVVIFCHHMVGTVAFADTTAQSYDVVGRVL